MALHGSGQIAEARGTLAAAILAHDRRANQVSNQNDWILHVLRRAAERMILPILPAFLAGNYQPQDNDERLALLGVCQFTNRARALACLYANAYAAVPQLAKVVGIGHRHNSARAAALTGSGEDGGNLSQEERARWRRQTHAWLNLDLAAWARRLDSGIAGDHALVRRTLTRWLIDPGSARLREPGVLETLAVEEQDEWLALWKEVDAHFNRAAGE